MEEQLRQHQENQKKLNELLVLSKKQDERMDIMEQKNDEMYLVFSNVKNFNSISTSFLKALIYLGSAIVAVGGAWEIIKAFFKHQ